jgi:hypothetical protein
MSRLLSLACLVARFAVIGAATASARAVPPATESQVAAITAAPMPSPAMSGPAMHDARHDFDFLGGRWFARNRRLTRPLDPAADEWEAFDSVHDGVLLPYGFGVADDFRIPARPEFVGLALQLYDARTGQWQAYWYRNGVLTASLRGRFVDGVGVFEGPDVHEGRAIRTRYTWSQITPASARWEQAYSADDGRTWETNWTMEYRRTEAE